MTLTETHINKGTDIYHSRMFHGWYYENRQIMVCRILTKISINNSDGFGIHPKNGSPIKVI